MIPYLVYNHMTRNTPSSAPNGAAASTMSGEASIARPQTPDSPPSPSASFYDMSDDEEGEYNTIRHTRTGKGVKLLFSKSKVYVHPTPSSKDNIAGFLALLQQKPSPSSERPTSSGSTASKKDSNAASLLLAWVPEHTLTEAALESYIKVDLSETSSPPKTSFLVPAPPISRDPHNALGSYAFSLPVSQIFSMTIRPPSIGWWYGSMIVNTKAGDSFPALFFHDDECQSTILQRKRLAKDMDPFGESGGMFWGGDEVLRWLKRYVAVERSGAEPSVYLIDPSEDDKLNFGNKATVDRTPKTPEPKDKKDDQKKDAGMSPLTAALKEARWGLLERMSQITTLARRAGQAVAENKNVPPQVRRLIQNPEVQTLQEEFDSARIYLARWAMGIAEQSEKERTQRMWSAKDFLDSEDSAVGSFELLDFQSAELADKRKPVTLNEWTGWFDAQGRLTITPDEVKDRIFHGGLDPDDGVRKEAWMFLLGVYEWNSSLDERKAMMNSKRDEYIRLKGQWWERMVEGNNTAEEREWWREQKGRIEKDVHRTDRTVPLFAGEDTPHPDPDSPFADQGTNVHLEQMKDMLLTYNEYNRDLGYVQGMSDLLAPIYAVEQDDAQAFWGFVGFMDRMERNFLRDQSGMRSQLLTLDHLVQLLDPTLYTHLQKCDSTNFFFFFRMLLVWFKREFDFPDVLCLWERLWTDWASGQFVIFIAVAILEKHRDVIMNHLRGFDEVLKYVNELSGTIDLEPTLIGAEALFRRFQRTVEAIDKKHNFPAPSNTTLRQRKTPGSPEPSSSSDNGKQPAGQSTGNAIAQAIGADHEKIISPELRALLDRKAPVLKKEEVAKHGGGLGS